MTIIAIASTHITAMKRRARRDEPTGAWITLKETP